MTSARIAILFLEQDRPQDYVISAMTEYWREDGHSVEYVMGTRKQVEADLLILHVNLSVVPDAYVDFARRYPRTVNLQVRDIRKRSFSSMVVTDETAWDGPVILKTNLNYDALPEIWFDPSPWVRRGYRWRKSLLNRWLAWRDATAGGSYKVFPSIARVPWFCRRSPFWIVEKFIPEKIDGFYAVRTYHFMGNQECSFVMLGREPVVKSDTVVETRAVESDPRLRQLRDQLHFDYGKFDYVLAGGEPVLLDLNKTVGLTRGYSRDPAVEKARRARARGLYDFLN